MRAERFVLSVRASTKGALLLDATLL